MATAPLEIMGYDRAILTHHPALNPPGPITLRWCQAASQSTAEAARPPDAPSGILRLCEKEIRIVSPYNHDESPKYNFKY